MDAKTIQFTLSADLVSQLEKAGLLEDMAQVERIFEQALEQEEVVALRRATAVREIEVMFAKLDQIPESERITPEEIQAEIDTYKAERRAARENRR